MARLPVPARYTSPSTSPMARCPCHPRPTAGPRRPSRQHLRRHPSAGPNRRDWLITGSQPTRSLRLTPISPPIQRAPRTDERPRPTTAPQERRRAARQITGDARQAGPGATTDGNRRRRSDRGHRRMRDLSGGRPYCGTDLTGGRHEAMTRIELLRHQMDTAYERLIERLDGPPTRSTSGNRCPTAGPCTRTGEGNGWSTTSATLRPRRSPRSAGG
jgi:hypothetical protein